MMESYNEQVLALSQTPENNKCVDCGTANPQWASITFGTFICLNCASDHRSFGVQISRVRSVNMDNWTESMYNTMQKNGNAKFHQILRKLGIYGADKNSIYRNSKLQALYKQASESEVRPKANVSYDFLKNRNLNKAPVSSEQSLQERLVSSFWSVSSYVKDKALIIKDKGLQIGQDLHSNYISPTAASLKEKALDLTNKNNKKAPTQERKPQPYTKQPGFSTQSNKPSDTAKWD